MARKLGLGWGVILGAAILLAGCQTGFGSRLAQNHAKHNPAVAKQGANMPQPQFPIASTPNSNGFGTAGSSFPVSPNVSPISNQSAFPTQPNITPVTNPPPPPGPQGLGVPATSNRNVTFTQPMTPMVPASASGFADPGFAPILLPQAPTAPTGIQPIPPPAPPLPN